MELNTALMRHVKITVADEAEGTLQETVIIHFGDISPGQVRFFHIYV